MDTFWASTLSNLCSTFVGAILAVLGALWVERWRQRRNLQAHRQQILKLLRYALEKNLKLLQQLLSEIKPSYVVFYDIDLLLLNSIDTLKYEVLEDLSFIENIEWIRFELSHLRRKLDLQLHLWAKGDERSLLQRNEIVESIRQHLPYVIEKVCEVLRQIDSKINC